MVQGYEAQERDSLRMMNGEQEKGLCIFWERKNK